MPTYEFKCRDCADTFEVNRPMSESSAPASCPSGHTDTVKLLTMAGLGGRAGGAAPAMAPSGGGGGCCGGGCCG
ncbi:zinc ribbon domain-containing protein [Kibdelosporangium philippinense]|uniref:Zinc ribbon domain-containing protein n=1 Tax=Kibdelosporangium philippinense TaxID=211113 RepID=A0ABS8ZLI3_9PSEU|nr:zinc ribbon domain-containing protein [Kibdelosporangium philippinense]MCE7008008.1 zinc ribbon domain-containing protein [Kibdelosporangium philippinense]